MGQRLRDFALLLKFFSQSTQSILSLETAQYDNF